MPNNAGASYEAARLLDVLMAGPHKLSRSFLP